MEIIEYSSSWAEEITNLFYNSVHAIDSSIYSNREKNAWAPKPIDYGKWKCRLDDKKPYLLIIRGEVAGFIELESDGHIDCTYVLPKYQNIGVATLLLQHVFSVAKELGLKNLYVEASFVSKPLFEKFGFIVKSKNEVIRNGVVLINYSMLVRV
ncbi:MAG: GNAT family N-acetyltransferase [Paraglaciecola sp.]|uniref:GNAT family N-acetyltransferase n=1 Tax=Paraglaciecola sp. TaxID=1920173 RepID=UPI00329A1524